MNALLRTGSARVILLGGMIAAGAAVLTAGPLTPPATLSSTYKTLSEVEPRTIINIINTPGDADSIYKITQPGSYYLIDNIAMVAGRHGIEIASSDVTIDLEGFTIQGLAGCLDGIAVTAVSNNVTIRHGIVVGCRNGVVMNLVGATNFSSKGNLLEDLQVSNCPASGQFDGNGILSESNAVIRNCTATSNGRTGIGCVFAGSIESCTAVSNANGFQLGEGSSISGCAAYLNGTGIVGSTACTMLNCSSFDNTSVGLSAANGSTLTNCSSYGNGTTGILAGSGSTIRGCSIHANAGVGVMQGNGSTGVGFTLVDCSARQNNSHGFNLPNGSSISNCTAAVNGGDGIRVINDSVVRDCVCDNGTTGIHATGNNNRIEGNNCTDAAVGIQVDSNNNIIVRNTCSSNTTNNWVIAAGNVCLVVQGVAAGAGFSGNAGGAAQVATDPNVNFTY